LGECLAYPTTFFLQTDRVWGTASPHHRRRKSLTPSHLQQLEARLNVVRLHVRRLMMSVELRPPFDVPAWDLDEIGSPSQVAQELRRYWRVPSGPVANVTQTLEDAGVVIVELDLPPKVDAISVWGPGEPPVILLNGSIPVDRKRQTLMHETGHLVMHLRDVTADPEGEADTFAREFLMPESEIRPELRELALPSLADIKRRWKVAMRNVIYHARALGEISPDRARFLFMRLNQAYGAKVEPIEIPPEPATLLHELLNGHLVELGYSIEQLAAAINVDPDEFKEIYGLSPRHLRVV
jgi:Zn-dependent peptidase ImmA (M78 family)